MNLRFIIRFLRVGAKWLTVFATLGGNTNTYAGQPVIHHDLVVELAPAAGLIRVTDRITVPSDTHEGKGALEFSLDPKSVLESVPRGTESFSQKSRRVVRLPHGSAQYELAYRSPATFNHEHPSWLYLAPSALWYPQSNGFDRLTFTLRVKAPAGWRAVSQGHGSDCRTASDSQNWRQPRPQTGIFLIAARFSCFQRLTPHGMALIYLLNPDEKLAETYLDGTRHYLELYSNLFGAYPYEKFALVENPRQTGYGMPSFTLLGSKVIRLPFIPHTSYPHEILHNWWGNGVYVNLESGNWAEGLTAYLADHALRERRGRGRNFRRDALQKFMNYVYEGGDFPLKDFVSRHDGASQAVGYDKSLMMFHMLRKKLGDKHFLDGLRTFFDQHQFKFASFGDLRDRFEEAGKVDLNDYFSQWTERTGAPSLLLADVRVRRAERQFVLEFSLRQAQSEAPFRLSVPFQVTLDGSAPAHFGRVTMDSAEHHVSLTLPTEPLRLDIDPDFDLFRNLLPGEIPASLGALFGAKKRIFVLPQAVASTMRRAYRRLAEQWADEGDEIIDEDDLTFFPRGTPIWLFDTANRHAGAVLEELPEDEAVTARVVRRHRGSAVLATRQGEQIIGLLHLYAADHAQALARKLPHYGKYSFVLLDKRLRERPKKGQWRTAQSRLSWVKKPGVIAVKRREPRLLETSGYTTPGLGTSQQ